MTTPINSVLFAQLPLINADFAGGKFAGITTQKDGTHVAVILLPDRGKDLTWQRAIEWAKKLDAELPTRPVAALLFANVQTALDPKWHWTADEYSASGAWYCYFYDGYQNISTKSAEGAAVAVRLIPIIA